MKRCAAVLVAAVAGVVILLGGFAFGEDHAPGNDQDGVSALVDLLKEKGMLSQEDADRFHKGYRKESPDQGLAALVEMLKAKKMLSEEEATRFTRTYVTTTSGAKTPTIASDRRDKEYMERITTNVTEEVRKGMQDQVKRDVREEVAREMERRKALGEKSAGGHEDEQSKELNQDVSHLTQKVAELYSGKAAELAASAPEWTKRIRFGGDVRLRYEADRFDSNNATFAQPSNPSQLMNTTADQNLFKYRVRAGVEADVAEDMTGNSKLQAAIGLSTGNTTNPVSTNSILGDFMNKDSVVIDHAYLKYTLKTSGYMPTVLTVYGGRIPNPWLSSDLVWDSDLNFEGLALKVKQPLDDTDTWTAFLTAGGFPLQQEVSDFKNHSKWLVAGQLGVEKKDRTGIAARMGAAYYYFNNITGIANDPLHPGATDWTAPLFQQKGNTLFNISADPAVVKTAYASEFKELNLTGTLDIGFWDPVHVVALGDFVKNFGFNSADVAQRTGQVTPKNTTGYQIGLSVGRPAIQTDYKWSPNWKGFVYYKYLGADAVVDAFTDSDFHLGGTNAKGWILGGEVGLMKNTWLTLRWLTSNEISGPPLGIDVLQFDFNVKF